MDDCLVARNATKIIKRALVRARNLSQPALSEEIVPEPVDAALPILDPTVAALDDSTQLLGTNGDDSVPGDTGVGWLDAYPYDMGNQALFWTEWANELDGLGNLG